MEGAQLSVFSPWLSPAGLRPGALLPSLRLPDPPLETHQSLMGGWCRTPLSPKNREPAQDIATLPAIGPWKAWMEPTHAHCFQAQPIQQDASGERIRVGRTGMKSTGPHGVCGPHHPEGDSSMEFRQVQGQLLGAGNLIGSSPGKECQGPRLPCLLLQHNPVCSASEDSAEARESG